MPRKEMLLNSAPHAAGSVRATPPMDGKAAARLGKSGSSPTDSNFTSNVDRGYREPIRVRSAPGAAIPLVPRRHPLLKPTTPTTPPGPTSTDLNSQVEVRASMNGQTLPASLHHGEDDGRLPQWSEGYPPLYTDSVFEKTPVSSAVVSKIDGLPSPLSSLKTVDEEDLSLVDSQMPSPVPSEKIPPTAFAPQIAYRSAPSAHAPVPSMRIFSPGSPSLYLPYLDQHLSSIPAPDFESSGVFPGLEPLQTNGLAALENNDFSAGWRRGLGGRLLDIGVGLVLSTLGSNLISAFYNLQGAYQALQMFATILGSVDPNLNLATSSVHRMLLYTIPNVLALNLSSALGFPVLFLTVLLLFAIVLEYVFYRVTKDIINSNGKSVEGWSVEPWKLWGNGKRAALMALCFCITILYLPLSTMALQALLWSSTFWPSPNSQNLSQNCYRTSIDPESMNLAWIVVPTAVAALAGITLYHPIRLAKTIKVCLPRVDEYTELGRQRTNVEREHEYQRMLDRDKSPFCFLYKDYRKEWGIYQSLYLIVKVLPLLLVTLITNTNCLFLSQSEAVLAVIRESLLILVMLVFLLVQSFAAPFVDPVSNASEWVSRLTYVLIASVGFLAALNPSSQAIWNGPVLYVVEGLYYSLDVYFTVIDWSFVHRFVKRITRRVDFSIDIFSPNLDTSPSSLHIKRRVWQETLSVVLVSAPEFRMPPLQKLIFAEFPDAARSQWPPVQLDFTGSVAERHVENLKILRESGTQHISEIMDLYTGDDTHEYQALQRVILDHFVGPDSYWSPEGSSDSPGSWGNAWIIPFPFTVVIRYDNGSYAVVSSLKDLRAYVTQNSDASIIRRCRVRRALRSLDGAIVTWPHTETKLVGGRWFSRQSYRARVSVHHETCQLRLKRNGQLQYDGVQLASGFDVSVVYAGNVILSGTHIGLREDFSVTSTLARFLVLNETLLYDRLPSLTSTLASYRHQIKAEARRKKDVLSYEFMTCVYETPMLDPDAVAIRIGKLERNPLIKELPVRHHNVLRAAHARMLCVTSTQTTTWWYLFWDDFWRRNHDTISQLPKHASDFNPHFTTSIAYRPLPRAALESFLTQRGLLNDNLKRTGFLHSGLLNKIYFYLNQLAFRGTDKIIAVHFGDSQPSSGLEEGLLPRSHERFSSVTTGGGTSHDDSSIRARPAYAWEGVFKDPIRKGKRRTGSRWWGHFGVWFGITPLERTRLWTMGMALDVVLSAGRYVRIADRTGRE